MMLRSLVVAQKELRQLRRDRLTLAMMVMLPLLQLVLFGYAINTDVRNIPTVVYDQDKTAASRDIVRSLEATGFYRIVGHVESTHGIESALRQSAARVAVVIPPDFGSDLVRGTPARSSNKPLGAFATRWARLA